MSRHIAVIDIGKTNAKLALVDAGNLQELAVVTRPNRVLPGPPWPHFDLDGHWQFFLEHLRVFHASHGVDAISVTTHGAAAVLLDRVGNLAAPMLDYEHDGPDDLAAEYDALRPDFALTGAPRLPMGLNLGAQLFWQLRMQPDLATRLGHVLTYPQYWGWRLTGEMASDVTSLGCHTDLWEPWAGAFSPLVARLGLSGRIAPPRRPGEILGGLLLEVAAETGLRPGTPVTVGIHDSNASLYPYVLGMDGPFSVVSTGTWVVAMAMGGDPVALDPGRDVLVNVNALGQAVPSARFMGGREYELIRDGAEPAVDPAARTRVLDKGVFLMPAVEPGSGPYAGRVSAWSRPPADTSERLAALSLYLALMTQTCLGLIGARGPAVIEGPFARNADYLALLAALRPEGVAVAQSTTGTSVGAAMLIAGEDAAATRSPALVPALARVAVPPDAPALRAYAQLWQAAAEAG